MSREVWEERDVHGSQDEWKLAQWVYNGRLSHVMSFWSEAGMYDGVEEKRKAQVEMGQELFALIRCEGMLRDRMNNRDK